MTEKKRSSRLVGRLGVAAVATLASTSTSFAQVLDEVIVTAQKRAESLQEVPIAVTALSADDLRARGVTDVTDLQAVSSSFSVQDANDTTRSGSFRIRNLGTTGNNSGLESAVGTFIDGVYRSRSGLAFQDLVDVERVEILRGPQGTLFGKNTSAGLIHIITKKPALDWEANALAQLGNYNERRFQASVSGPLVDDKLAMRLAFSSHNREGYAEDINTGAHYNGRDRWSAKGQLLWAPTPNFEMRIIADYSDHNEDCCASVAFTSGFPPTKTGLEHKVSLNHAPAEVYTDAGIQAEGVWNVGDMNITSLIAHRKFDVSKRRQDQDHSNVDLLLPQDQDFETWKNDSLELRADGNYEPLAMKWLVGTYIYREELDTVQSIGLGTQLGSFLDLAFGALAPVPGYFATGGGIAPGPVIVAGDRRVSNFAQKATGWAAFTQNTFALTDSLDFTIGARYLYEKKEVTHIANGAAIGNIVNIPTCGKIEGADAVPGASLLGLRAFLGSVCDNFSFENEISDHSWAGTVNLTYQFTDDINGYVSASRGYKAGGFNIAPFADHCIPVALAGSGPPGSFTTSDGIDCRRDDRSTFGPEISYNYEIGLKTQFFDRELTINSAVFHTTFDGYQVSTFTGLALFVENIPRVSSTGLEIELSYKPVDWLSLQWGATYADSKFGDDIGGINAFRSGRRLNNAPELVSNVSWLLRDNVPNAEGLDWFFSGNVYFSSRYFTNAELEPLQIQKAYTKVNARIGIGSSDDRWQLALFGTNLTDEITNTFIFDRTFAGAQQSAYQGAPRTYGVELSVKW